MTATMHMSRRLRVLLSAYACEPGKGSEPGQGWSWTRHLAAHVDLTVITRANNRPLIENALAHLDASHPLRSVRFLYFDLGRLWLRFKRLGYVWPYYFAWQHQVANHYNAIAEKQDIVHHVTFNSIVCPGFWRLKQAALILGPLGAPITPAGYIRLFGRSAPIQWFRNKIISRCPHVPPIRHTLKKASAVIAANPEVCHLLDQNGIACEETMTDAWGPDVPQCIDLVDPKVTRFFYMGGLERRKGIELILRSFSECIKRGLISQDNTLSLIGDGPDRPRLERLCHSLGLPHNNVHFRGRLPHDQAIAALCELDVLLFTTIRDTSGNVILEAMTNGKPVICLKHQGAGFMTNDDCAIHIPLYPSKTVHQRLSNAMAKLTNDPALRQRMGTASRAIVLNRFAASVRVERILNIYAKAIDARTERSLIRNAHTHRS